MLTTTIDVLSMMPARLALLAAIPTVLALRPPLRPAPPRALPTLQANAAELLAEGNACYVNGDLDGAGDSYGACVDSGEWPVVCDCAANLGSVALDRDDPEEAERLYRFAVDAAAAPPAGALDGAGFFHADAAQNLASLLQGRGGQDRTREAAHLYRDVVRADASRWDAWANLGAALVDTGAPKLDAVKCFQRGIRAAEAVERDEASPPQLVEGIRGSLADMYFGLGTALADLDDLDRAAAYDDGEILLTAYDERVDLYDGTQADADAAIAETAANALRAAVDLRGGDFPLAAHALDALAARDDALAAPGRASPAFVRALFDDFAPTFDAQLVDTLMYRAPEMVAAAAGDRVMGARNGTPYGATLDAGCGTGLLGPPLREFVDGPLVGADLSGNMVELARDVAIDGTPVYDALAVGDLTDMGLYANLSAGPYDLVAAADVLVYFGVLDEVLAIWADHLAPGGDVIFTCERMLGDGGDWVLGPSGRYAHRPEYVEAAAAAAGLALVSATDVVPRVENGEDVPGTLYVLTTAL